MKWVVHVMKRVVYIMKGVVRVTAPYNYLYPIPRLSEIMRSVNENQTNNSTKYSGFRGSDMLISA